ncbi:tetratricopeptide repeat-containing sensor histidine kinase [Lacibacter sp. H407]|uniref:tetratricopeptide repeat-containing sensor histidine kinase n=1 Tax=Lacibacter sp. H407 TaxID=3133423 RepID=UPI0030BFF06A
MKKLLFYTVFLFTTAHAQVLMNRDSLLKLLPQVKDNKEAVDLYINLGQQYESNEPAIAKFYYRKAGDLSKKINYPEGETRYIFNYTYVLNVEGKFDSSLQLNLLSVALAKKTADPELIGKALFNTGTSYRILSQYQNAAVYYEEGKKIFAGIMNESMEAKANDILQILYYDLKDYERAVFYGEKAVQYFRKTTDSVWLGNSLNNLGLSYSKQLKCDKAESSFEEVVEIGSRINNLDMHASALLNLADLSYKKGDYEMLKTAYEQVLAVAKELNSKEIQAISYRGISIYYFFKRDFQQAKNMAMKALAIVNEEQMLPEKAKIFEELSRIYYARQDVVTGQQYAVQAAMILDSINNDQIKKDIIDIEKKYESERKDNQIKLQQSELKQKSFINYLLVGSAATILIISLLSYRNYRHKQTLQQQRISELETEKQLAATEAVLQGEEQERTRLAKDLHDGLGGMLSGIKYTLNNMKGNLIMTPENAQAFGRSIDMLDSSIREMRRVAHNMMPEALVKFGLDTAMQDFCYDINKSGALQVQYQSIGLKEADIDQTKSVTIYRIVQELLNNTMKHASAKNAVVQLSYNDDVLTITVEDDGKGFDPSILNQSKGIGWSNIQNRIQFLKGKWDVDSQPGKGTSVIIEMTA